MEDDIEVGLVWQVHIPAILLPLPMHIRECYCFKVLSGKVIVKCISTIYFLSKNATIIINNVYDKPSHQRLQRVLMEKKIALSSQGEDE